MTVLKNNIDHMFHHFGIYNLGNHWSKCLNSLIYIVMMKYAIKSKHHKYIHYDESIINKLALFTSLFDKME